MYVMGWAAVLKNWDWRRLLLLSLFALAVGLCRPLLSEAGVENDYHQAKLSAESLLKDPEKQKDRLNWLLCIEKFRAVYRAQLDGPRADDSLFMMGQLYTELYKEFANRQDRHEALDYYLRLLGRYPDTPYKAQAKGAISELRKEKESSRQQEDMMGSLNANENGAEGGSASQGLRELGEARGSDFQGSLPAQVEDLRFWSNPTYTRVVIDVSGEVPYTHRLLKEDPHIGKPRRFYVDIKNARKGVDLKPVIQIGDELLIDARAAQYKSDIVRVVLYIKSIDDFSIFSLRNPFRIVVDINGVPKTASSRKALHDRGVKPRGGTPNGSLAKQLALGVQRIVIDPGHGGKDPGALGYYKGILEKNVALEVSKRLAKKIRQRLSCEAILTRNRDISLSLEERTAIANTKNADIFISVHANAHRNRRICGVETYILDKPTDNEALLVAARENATSTKNISDLQMILSDLMKNAKVNESTRLANHVQQALMKHLKPNYKGIRDKGIKQAPFYVLMGAHMPCILVEIAFMSNPGDCRRLNTASYQEDVADAIVTGLESYIEEISPVVVTKATETFRFGGSVWDSRRNECL